MTAYALREAIRDVLGHFWNESFGQIYPTLYALEADGHVIREGGQRARSSTFTITASGRARLRDLLDEPVQESPPRNGLLLRLFFGRALGPQRCADLLRQAQTQAQVRLAELEGLLVELTAAEGHTPDWPYIRLTILAGIRQARASADWAAEGLASLDAVTPDTGASS
ncbi:DNA-binding PadR family transcriptional regulator [Allocatelliglobosispora scoriae]|uniref:DNA-binding PadR family transcriptional regulator n=1 Tax=Allocatelliglobosispora scoriae TaxID=643052 RepID=A0A841BJ83_9ACTN|nr:DNA-binding PadR family transcriptional regulator [Allocatelliglobosispora scoriae]